ncbi:hypothetical protein, partial [Vibrio parahaemolyticus]|uniref:hypothetical protein n=1 Tax=Vibrio parahaemolyticus TaxID=670 RepID=UPI003133BD88
GLSGMPYVHPVSLPPLQGAHHGCWKPSMCTAIRVNPTDIHLSRESNTTSGSLNALPSTQP